MKFKPDMTKQKIQLRECALQKQAKPVEQLLRFALSPDDQIAPDIDAKAPGRGVWISDNARDVNEAVKKNAFAKSLKQKVKVPSELAQITRTRLEQRLKGALGLARKAGQLQTGATRVKSAISSGSVLALITATDAAVDGRRKILAALKATGNGDEVPQFDILTSLQLGLALGQENVIHAALTRGAAAKSALSRVKKLIRYDSKDDLDLNADLNLNKSLNE